MRENRAAVAGLMAGNIGFVVLFVGGIVGVVLGLIALARSRSPQIRGRGMAIASIVSSAAITYITLRTHEEFNHAVRKAVFMGRGCYS